MAKNTKATTKATTKAAPAPLIQLATRVDANLHAAVKVACAVSRIKMQDAIALGLQMWLDSQTASKKASK